MYTGCPLICSDVYGMRNQVKNGGIFVNPKSYEDIYKKILILLKNKKLQNQIIKNGFKIIQKNKKNNFLKSLDRLI